MRWRAVVLNSLGTFLLWTTAGAQIPVSTPYSLNIPAEPLGDALNALAQQTGLQILYSSQLVARMQAPEVKGSLSAEQALGRMLGGTGLRFEFVNVRTITILG